MTRFTKTALVASLAATTLLVGTTLLAQTKEPMDDPAPPAAPDAEVVAAATAPASVEGFESADAQTGYALGVSMAQQMGGQLRAQGFPLNAEAMAVGMAKGVKDGEIDEEAGKALSFGLGFDRGRQIGQNFQQMGVPIQGDDFAAGFRDAISEGQMKLSDAEVMQTLTDFQQRMALQQGNEPLDAEAFEAGAKANLDAGEAFLKENADKPGVVTMESGMQYKIIEPGNDQHPDSNDVVTVHYTGTLMDGTVFDSSRDADARSQFPSPATFPLDGVIDGWTQGLQEIGEGGRIQLWIPGPLAYGANASSPTQGPGGPNALLTFDVELLYVLEQPNEDAMAPGVDPTQEGDGGGMRGDIE